MTFAQPGMCFVNVCLESNVNPNILSLCLRRVFCYLLLSLAWQSVLLDAGYHITLFVFLKGLRIICFVLCSCKCLVSMGALAISL